MNDQMRGEMVQLDQTIVVDLVEAVHLIEVVEVLEVEALEGNIKL
jgi:hypothetical protein